MSSPRPPATINAAATSSALYCRGGGGVADGMRRASIGRRRWDTVMLADPPDDQPSEDVDCEREDEQGEPGRDEPAALERTRLAEVDCDVRRNRRGAALQDIRVRLREW